MATKAFLHIGGEKTGTTTLQRFLTRNAALLKRAGFYYPCEADNICVQEDGHFPVAACVIDGDVEFVTEKRRKTLPSVLNKLRQVCLATDDAVILSCEHFSSRLTRPQQLRSLRDALPTDAIKIVFYAREQSELSLAAWSTSVLAGARRKFDIDAITPAKRYFNHLATLDLWAEAFGAENVIVREYDRDLLIGGDIRRDFCHSLGIELDNPLLDGDQNLSLDAQRLEVLRQINNALPQFHESAPDWGWAGEIRRLVAEHIPEGAPLKGLMSEHDAIVIKSRFHDVNQQLNQRYFGGRLSRKWFAELALSGVPAAAPVSDDPADLVPILRDTIIRIARVTREYEIERRKTSVQGSWRRLRKALRAMRLSRLPGRAGPTAYH